MIFVGLDWSEGHHDVALMDPHGAVLREFRIDDSLGGINRLHAIIAEQAGDDDDVVVGIETAHGLVPRGLVAAGYAMYDINPLAASRYRDRHHVSGAKSDKADAKMLADLVRTDRQNHRRYVGDSELTESIKILARGHKTLIRTRLQQLNHLRSSLRVFFPAALIAFPRLALAAEIDSAEGLALLARAPEPAAARALSAAQIAALLRRAGRKRTIDARANEIQRVLREDHLEAPPAIAAAYGKIVGAIVAAVQPLSEQIIALEVELTARFRAHPDASIIDSIPGLGVVLGARVLAEFGDQPDRYRDARARKTTPARPRSPSHRAPSGSSPRGTSATTGSPTHATAGPSLRSRVPPGRGATTTRSELDRRTMTRRCARCRTGWWASSTAASDIASCTARMWPWPTAPAETAA